MILPYSIYFLNFIIR